MRGATVGVAAADAGTDARLMVAVNAAIEIAVGDTCGRERGFHAM